MDNPNTLYKEKVLKDAMAGAKALSGNHHFESVMKYLHMLSGRGIASGNDEVNLYKMQGKSDMWLHFITNIGISFESRANIEFDSMKVNKKELTKRGGKK